MNIPDEAVEAAAIGIWEARPMERVYEEGPDYGAAKPWDSIKPYQRDRCRTLARAALEDAAPHLLARVLELHAKRLGGYTDHDGISWAGEHCGHCRVEWPCATIEVLLPKAA